MRILIADDDDVSRKLLALTLGAQGHDVAEAADGDEAWKFLHAEHFPVVIADWLMPRVDGLELCRRIRAEPRERYTYVVVLTVRAGKADYLAGMAAGADDFLVKPADDDQLAARLHVAQRVLALQDENRLLAALIPICSFCRSVRNDRGYWERLADFLTARGARFSHGVCDACFQERYPELWAKSHGAARGG